MLVYYTHSTHELTTELVTEATGAGLAGATVTCAVLDRQGDVLMGTTGMTDVGAGSYTVTIPHTLAVVSGERFIARISAVKAGVYRFAEVPVRAKIDND